MAKKNSSAVLLYLGNKKNQTHSEFNKTIRYLVLPEVPIRQNHRSSGTCLVVRSSSSFPFLRAC